MTLAQTNCLVLKLTLSDLAACWALDQRCFPVIEAYDRDFLRYLLANPYSVSYKLIRICQTVPATTPPQDAALIGFIVGQIDHNHIGHVVRLAIAPEYQRQGYGHQLLQSLEIGLQAIGITTIHLQVRATNRPAIRLYVQADYIIVERLPQYYQDGEDGLMMIKALNLTTTGNSNEE